MKTVICWPGLKPSARFQSRGSMCSPSALAGIAGREREPQAGRRLAVVPREPVVRQGEQAPLPPSGSQRFVAAWAGVAIAAVTIPAASAAKNLRVIPLSSSCLRPARHASARG